MREGFYGSEFMIGLCELWHKRNPGRVQERIEEQVAFLIENGHMDVMAALKWAGTMQDRYGQAQASG